MDKVAEEIEELRAEIDGPPNSEAIADELGDVLFAVVNVCRYLKVDPETALRNSNGKFERRFRYVERRLKEQGIEQATLAQMDELWEEGKERDRHGGGQPERS